LNQVVAGAGHRIVITKTSNGPNEISRKTEAIIERKVQALARSKKGQEELQVQFRSWSKRM
jgi:hypothetical protein